MPPERRAEIDAFISTAWSWVGDNVLAEESVDIIRELVGEIDRLNERMIDTCVLLDQLPITDDRGVTRTNLSRITNYLEKGTPTDD
jgi:hypothetical protein